jgi:hypothetical protein
VEEGELMPYIKSAKREEIDKLVPRLMIEIADVGDLNYTLTCIAVQYLLGKGLNYEHINAVAGVLQKVAAEFDVRVTRPYEELKKFQNGDVSDYAEVEKVIANSYPVS